MQGSIQDHTDILEVRFIMTKYHNFLTPSLTPNSVVDFQLPDLPRRGTSIASQSIVRQLDIGEWKEAEPLGLVKRIAVDQEKKIVGSLRYQAAISGC
jgi:hypothetical protein